MPTTSSSALRYPSSTASPNVPQDIQNLASDLDRKVAPQFTSIALRNTGIPSPIQGQSAAVAGNFHMYSGTAWKWIRTGFTTATTDVNGLIVIPHGLGATPSGVVFGRPGQASTLLNNIVDFGYSTTDSSNFVCWVRRDDTNAVLPSNLVNVAWIAYV